MPEEETKTDEKKESNKDYALVEVTTQTAPAIQRPNGEVIMQEQAIVEILNKLDKIENAVA